MHLTRHKTKTGSRWAADGSFLRPEIDLSQLLRLPAQELLAKVREAATQEPANATLLSPIDNGHEIWAAGVTYLSSRMAREAESESADVYQKVYNAARPELFFKSTGTRCCHPMQDLRIRSDSSWDVPEPELTLVINAHREVIGFTAGNDLSSRSIEGENPLYLPQAKVYSGSCSIGPSICLASAADIRDISISLEIRRGENIVFEGQSRTSQMKRSFEELVDYLYREMDFPEGAFLMTGTGIVPPENFTLRSGDSVEIHVGKIVLQNKIQ